MHCHPLRGDCYWTGLHGSLDRATVKVFTMFSTVVMRSEETVGEREREGKDEEGARNHWAEVEIEAND